MAYFSILFGARSTPNFTCFISAAFRVNHHHIKEGRRHFLCATCRLSTSNRNNRFIFAITHRPINYFRKFTCSKAEEGSLKPRHSSRSYFYIPTSSFLIDCIFKFLNFEFKFSKPHSTESLSQRSYFMELYHLFGKTIYTAQILSHICIQ